MAWPEFIERRHGLRAGLDGMRAARAIEACAQTVPPLDELSAGHFSACIRKDLIQHEPPGRSQGETVARSAEVI